ncbi:MAG: F0F1 ATP synthase subunit epsilon [Pseudomonadota bacterium]
MANTFLCEIVSAEEHLFSENLTMLVCMGEMGELGITPGHTPLLTSLKPGVVRIFRENGSEDVFYVSGGILEVQPKHVTILADTAARAHDLDESAALEAKQEAERLLQNQSSEIDYGTAAARLAEVSAQLQAIRKLKNRAQ